MALFEPAYRLTSQNEGGYQKISSDPGNFNSLGELVGTNYGISARFYERVIGRPPSEADMKDISKSEAESIYKKHFWEAYDLDEIKSQIIANQVFDMFVNHAPDTAYNIIRNALRKYGYDAGRSNLIHFINRMVREGNDVKLNNEIARQREKWMRHNAPSGWANILINRAKKYYRQNPGFAVLAIFVTSLPVLIN